MLRVRPVLADRHAAARPLPALDNVTDFLLTFKPPSAAVDAVEVELDVLLCDLEGLDLLAIRRLLFGLAHLGHDLLDELATLHFELGLDVVGREGGRQAVLREEVVEDAIIWLEVEECLLGI